MIKDNSWYCCKLLSFIDFENYIEQEVLLAIEMASRRRFIDEMDLLRSKISD
jgi:hypothetical protein